MKTCASCGKANIPTRKYCTRCGKLLIIVKDDKPSPTPIPEVKPTASASKDEYVRSDNVKATTDDVWVRPSQVSRDRVRSSSSSSGKSEFEKAKAVFAKAEGVGFEEATGSGVVEPRMLRASEVRELMGEGAVISQEPAPPTHPAPRVTSTPTPAAPTAIPTATPAHSPANPAPAQVRPSAPPVAQPTPSPPLASAAPTIPIMPATNKAVPTATPAPSAGIPPAAPVITSPKSITPAPKMTSTSSIKLDARVPEIEEVLSQVTEPEDLQDSKIKDLVAILTTQHAELRKVKEDLANVSARLDEFVRSCMNDAEVKRIHYESLCEQERYAKQEYESSKKEYERVDKRRKKEVSLLEDKVKNVEKNISKSEDSVKKRIEELDKVREKIAQLQSSGT